MDNPEVKREGKRYGYWVLASIAFLFFISTVVLATLLFGGVVFVRLFSLEKELHDGYIEETLEGRGEAKIVMIPLEGVITSMHTGIVSGEVGQLEGFKKRLDRTKKDANVQAILLRIDSPGGEITACDIIYNEIIKYKKEKGKKVVACMEDFAASGGYYIAAAADKIVAHPTTVTGSIGVILPLINISGLVERYGIEDKSISSGQLKGMGSPLKPMSEEEEAVFKSIVDVMFDRFITVVADGRNMPADDVRRLADGRIYVAEQAKSLGLVDQVGYLSDAIKLTKELAGLKEAKVIGYKKKWGLKDLLSIQTQRPSLESVLPEIPRLMYLWPGFSSIGPVYNFYTPHGGCLTKTNN